MAKILHRISHPEDPTPDDIYSLNFDKKEEVEKFKTDFLSQHPTIKTIMEDPEKTITSVQIVCNVRVVNTKSK